MEQKLLDFTNEQLKEIFFRALDHKGIKFKSIDLHKVDEVKACALVTFLDGSVTGYSMTQEGYEMLSERGIV